LDLEGRDGAALREMLAASNALPLAIMLQRLDRLFLLKSEWAPGLRFVGAQAQVGHRDGARSAMSFGGCGLSLEDSLASCIGEAAERLSQIERAGDICSTASLATSQECPPAIMELARAVLLRSGGSADDPCDWLRATDGSGKASALPADWCLRRANV